MRKLYTPEIAAADINTFIGIIDGRWKMLILFHLFDGKIQRYSQLQKLIPTISPKMLAQQLRQLEADGVITRTIYPEVPPRVEYSLSPWGQSLCPVLDTMLQWLENKDTYLDKENHGQ